MGAFDNPAPGQHDEALGLVWAFDDFNVEAGDAALEHAAAVAAMGVELEPKQTEAEERRHHQHIAVPVPGPRRGKLWMPA